ncbi:MAG: DNA methyltransferase [bacterium]|nr:DNA methyltransferase [bacterium]
MSKLPGESIHLSIYSPPFCGLYQYSSHERDLSNCDSYGDFMEHYGYVVREISRLTPPGRCTAVHCMDIPNSNSGTDTLKDFPGDIIRLHEQYKFGYVARHVIWKEPFAVRLRTMQKTLAHKTLVEDSVDCGVASADYLLIFRKAGENKVPVTHPSGLHKYAGERHIPADVLAFKGHKGKQIENRYSHWIWRQYASSFWDDIRIDNVLPFRDCKEESDEKHVHPLQLDVIERCIVLRTNPEEVVLTPFMGVGSEAYGAVINGRKAIGIELKTSYYRQAIKNMESATKEQPKQKELF